MFSKFVIILVVLKIGASTSPDSDRITAIQRIEAIERIEAIHRINNLHEALDDGNIEAALECANEIDKADISVLYDIETKSEDNGDWSNSVDSDLVYHTTPLNLALRYRQEEVAIKLLDRGADIFVADANGDTPLHLAAFRGLVNVVNKIMEIMGDIKIMNNAGKSKLQALVLKNEAGSAPLHFAIFPNCEAVFQKLLTEGADPMITDGNGNTALHLAIQMRLSQDIIIYIINAAGSTIVNIQNDEGLTALHVAASRTRVWEVEYLLEKGASRTILAYEKTALDMAKEKWALDNIPDDAKIVALLQPVIVARGDDIFVVDENGNTPLHLAAIHGLVNVVNKIMDIMGDIKIMNKAGRSKLQAINLKNKAGKAPLHLAVFPECEAVFQKLLIEGADPMITDRDGNTALHLAIEMGLSQDIIIYIINAAGSTIVNIQNDEGVTALHVAASCTRVWEVEYLLEKGASRTILAYEKTALDMAKVKWALDNFPDDAKIVALLQHELIKSPNDDQTELVAQISRLVIIR